MEFKVIIKNKEKLRNGFHSNHKKQREIIEEWCYVNKQWSIQKIP